MNSLVRASIWPLFLPRYPFTITPRVFSVNYLEPNPGPIYEMGTGTIVGTHGGLWTYTIGQGARLPGLKERHFVAAKSRAENAIYVVNGS